MLTLGELLPSRRELLRFGGLGMQHDRNLIVGNLSDEANGEVHLIGGYPADPASSMQSLLEHAGGLLRRLANFWWQFNRNEQSHGITVAADRRPQTVDL